MKGKKWKKILGLLKKNKKTISIAISEEVVGRYCEVILDGDGFRVKSDKSGMAAAFTGDKPSFRPISNSAEVLELAKDFDPDKFAEMKEFEIVAIILREIAVVPEILDLLA